LKFLITLAATILLSMTSPVHTAQAGTSGKGEPLLNQAQDTRATTKDSGKQKKARRKRSLRPRCRRVVIAKSTGAATTTPSGLTYIITRRSQERQPLHGETVVVNYTGLLGNGVKFDSSLDRGEPFNFPLGMGRVIKGWDEGIAKLRVGEQATLIIPPQLGYGERGAGGIIPPNATLIFLVELISTKEAPKTN
jgi:FKBP-type peptidyl-prolyl cis-trans isomerase